MNKKIALIIVISLLLRLISSQLTPVKWWDETVYANLGYDLGSSPLDYSFNRTWSDRNFDPPNAGYKAPLLPYSLSIIYLLTGGSEFAADMLLPLIGTLEVLFVFLLSKKMFDEKTAIFSSTLLAITPLHEIISGRILTDVYSSALITFSVLLFWLGFEKGNNKLKVACGATTGLAILARYNAIALPIVFLAYLVIRNRKLNFIANRYLALSVVTGILVVTPLFYYSYQTYDNPLGAFTHSSEAITYWGGTQPWYFYFVSMPSMTILFFMLALSILLLYRGKAKFSDNRLLLIALWVVIFLALSIYFPHKEDRFIEPILAPMLIIISISFTRIKFSREAFVLLVSTLALMTALEFYDLSKESYTDYATCFLMANDFLKTAENNSLVMTDSSPLVYYYTKKESIFFEDTYNESVVRLEEYGGRPIYILLTMYEADRPDYRRNLYSSESFQLAYSCPIKEDSAIVFRLLSHQDQ